jgi:hypothetical protein
MWFLNKQTGVKWEITHQDTIERCKNDENYEEVKEVKETPKKSKKAKK